jgi:hypothetical protein
VEQLRQESDKRQLPDKIKPLYIKRPAFRQPVRKGYSSPYKQLQTRLSSTSVSGERRVAIRDCGHLLLPTALLLLLLLIAVLLPAEPGRFLTDCGLTRHNGGW